MESIKSLKNNGNLFGILSLGLAVIILILILNWLFEMTPFQKLQGMPLLIAPFTSIIGFTLGMISLKKSPDRFAKSGLACNAILFFLPFIYWTIGTLVFGA